MMPYTQRFILSFSSPGTDSGSWSSLYAVLARRSDSCCPAGLAGARLAGAFLAAARLGARAIVLLRAEARGVSLRVDGRVEWHATSGTGAPKGEGVLRTCPWAPVPAWPQARCSCSSTHAATVLADLFSRRGIWRRRCRVLAVIHLADQHKPRAARRCACSAPRRCRRLGDLRLQARPSFSVSARPPAALLDGGRDRSRGRGRAQVGACCARCARADVSADSAAVAAARSTSRPLAAPPAAAPRRASRAVGRAARAGRAVCRGARRRGGLAAAVAAAAASAAGRARAAAAAAARAAGARRRAGRTCRTRSPRRGPLPSPAAPPRAALRARMRRQNPRRAPLLAVLTPALATRHRRAS